MGTFSKHIKGAVQGLNLIITSFYRMIMYVEMLYALLLPDALGAVHKLCNAKMGHF